MTWLVPEEVPLDPEVLGPIGDALLLGCKQQGAVVVLEEMQLIVDLK